MIRFDHFTYSYPDTTQPILDDLCLSIHEGEFVLVVGPSGAGKSTFLRALNGLVPHFHGGQVAGRVRVAGLDPLTLGPRGMAERVGFVFQDPESQFVVDTVEDELVFAMENFAVPLVTMRKRVEEVLDQLNIAHLRDRRISTLSGGEKQRVAIAAVLTLQPKVLVLDEPTSQLDPQAAEEVLIALRQLNEDLGLTVICAEHRLERVVQYADRILYFPCVGMPPLLDDPATVLAQIPLTPPLITLAKTLGWQPLPLTIKEGRRFVRANGEWRMADGEVGEDEEARMQPLVMPHSQVSPPLTPRHSPFAILTRVWHAYGNHETVRNVDLAVRPGEILAVMGRNGSGKTTLLKLLSGLLKPTQGEVSVAGLDTRTAKIQEVIRHIGYVPQQPASLLFSETVADEVAFTRHSRGLPADPAGDLALLHTLGIDFLANRHPRDLSAGEQQRVALAAILVAEPAILLLDEPTRGLDYPNKERLRGFLRTQRDAGRAVVMVTHDVELVAEIADRVALLADGEVILDGPIREVLADSLVFAPQIHKLYRDKAMMTVGDVLNRVSSIEQ
ncbi:MAG: energy-coupling factor ABC transporter ATP-binding protein [Caldilineaceae bacterium]|nr:energy-coupling factor ABC transporter ATP-binding protein [Caldilineaceae bacterium]MBP8106747.1 energy-coupling factor ABC transporter ATP-binding protein [Caldilineaceae bacterium]MBP8123382.1 energy-coupling factor ABC transporter ATP-binding protein [Caldilineaceae bacterium]MBP9073425.1 energy-coupling factor ABC transporter ATP-binding protein [Caldilineaceae bacterium]